MPPYSSNYQSISARLLEDFLPDANLSKSVWRNSKRVVLADTFHPSIEHPAASTEASALWSSHYLYVAFWCHYSDLNTYKGEDPQLKRWELWDRDVAEVFVNPFPETMHRYWEFEVAPNNQWVDLAIQNRGEENISVSAEWNSGFTHATSIDETARIWTCEMRIPVASMGVSQIHPGDEWRINFYRCDGLGDNSQRRFLAWSPTLKLNFHVPERFGLIRMGD